MRIENEVPEGNKQPTVKGGSGGDGLCRTSRMVRGTQQTPLWKSKNDTVLCYENGVSVGSGMIQCYLKRSTLTGTDLLVYAMWILANERKAKRVLSQEETVLTILTSTHVSQLPICDRVGLVIEARDFNTAVTRIRETEHAGVQQV